ncbi:similar to Saccharomyces cerevisiae YPL010W RET3 Zeta subunit of the coatomer complex (COPI), which coats Golgi-derived transport vesicles [Maudiozyma saulgeensis]|uniref:Coatomer subunit zeta n=1 Tax=Maudiozyma saulgeensis TaxID=1789683 RepID=A0A1X7R0E2_9SACH|nr:similar to Saccharomyces cerevisiae YPL010W RET3 Zeta subunit of the coatomer complex (COPI), which coats Golgi-derived transport vesicles [Kazachstania saulgeensis]
MSLYSVEGILVLDSKGDRIYGKYYNPPHSVSDEYAISKSLATSNKIQLEFEKQLFKKTHKKNAEIMLYENHLVLYKEYTDVTLYLIGDGNENELVLQEAFDAYRNSIELVLHNGVDKKNIQENYDLILLAIDELIDNGIILETDPASIASRVTKAPEESVTLDLDKGLLGAWGFAKSKFQERLQQGL